MTALSLLFAALVIAFGVGRLLLTRWLPSTLTLAERLALCTGVGLGVAGYSIYGLGLLGGLKFGPITALWGGLALIALPGCWLEAQDRQQRSALRPVASESERAGDRPAGLRVLHAGLVLAITTFLLLSLVACFRAPGAIEWDAISYHLADPKLFLEQGRIVPLPTEHHSNFPFTWEMLFAVSLLYQGWTLANMFHWAAALLTVFGMIGFCQRKFVAPGASARQRETALTGGLIAALLFVSTPLVLYEASVAYVDLALALYVSLACFAFVSALDSFRLTNASGGTAEASGAGDVRGADSNLRERDTGRDGFASDTRRWLILTGILLGFGLGVKYLALVPVAILLSVGLWQRLPRRALLQMALIAALIGSPWYAKNLVRMHNPVYPYLYSLFPQSRYWSADRARPYQAEQASFGFPHTLIQPAAALPNLLLSPWRLTSNADRYYNPGEFTFQALMGGLYAGLCLSLAFAAHVPRWVRGLLWLAGLQLAAWFFVSQVGRYLIHILPLLAVVGAWAVCYWTGLLTADPVETPSQRSGKPMGRMVAGVVAAHIVYTLWGVCFLPEGGREGAALYARLLGERNADPASLQAIRASGVLPTAWNANDLSDSLGSLGASETRLARTLDNYNSLQWINTNAPAGAGVVLFDDVKGFYLSRHPYLWGNAEHSSYIPYDKFPNAAAMTAWFREQGCRYALVNLNQTQGPVQEPLSALMQTTANPATDAPHWRQLLGEAIREGLWTARDAQHGCVVLEMNAATEGGTL